MGDVILPNAYRPEVPINAKHHIGPGWLPLVAELHETLLTTDPDYGVTQIKEKFGGLRFYTVGLTEAGLEAVHTAEVKSFTICEKCGNPGEPRGGGWIKTLCEEHADE